MIIHRLEKAKADPSTLTQDAIVENLDPLEAARLARVRNIGIAVRIHNSLLGSSRSFLALDMAEDI